MGGAVTAFRRLFNDGGLDYFIRGDATRIQTDPFSVTRTERNRTIFNEQGIRVRDAKVSARLDKLVVADPNELTAFYPKAGEMGIAEKAIKAAEGLTGEQRHELEKHFAVRMGDEGLSSARFLKWAEAIRVRAAAIAAAGVPEIEKAGRKL